MNYYLVFGIVQFILDTCTFSRYFERERERKGDKRKKGDLVR